MCFGWKGMFWVQTAPRARLEVQTGALYLLNLEPANLRIGACRTEGRGDLSSFLTRNRVGS